MKGELRLAIRQEITSAPLVVTHRSPRELLSRQDRSPGRRQDVIELREGAADRHALGFDLHLNGSQQGVITRQVHQFERRQPSRRVRFIQRDRGGQHEAMRGIQNLRLFRLGLRHAAAYPAPLALAGAPAALEAL